MLLWQVPQSLGREFGSHVALGGSQKLKTHHEFSHRGGAQQGREKMPMKVPLRVFCAVCGALMKAHGIRERNLKQVVVASGEAFEDVRQAGASDAIEGGDIGEVTLAQQQSFKGPGCPEGDDREIGIILADDSIFRDQFQGVVVTEETTAALAEVICERL